MKEVYINIKEFGDNSWLGKFLYQRTNKDLVSVDDLLGIIEDLKIEKEIVEEKLQDLQEDIDCNYYKAIPVSEQYE